MSSQLNATLAGIGSQFDKIAVHQTTAPANNTNASTQREKPDRKHPALKNTAAVDGVGFQFENFAAQTPTHPTNGFSHPKQLDKRIQKPMPDFTENGRALSYSMARWLQQTAKEDHWSPK